VLANRGIKPENIEHYLNTTNKDILDPKLIMNMREGAVMLIKHINQGNKILI
jgi:single-stranded DNA-specific DHH superfamily exonuclease